MVALYTQLLDRRYRGVLDKQAHIYLDFMVEGTGRMGQLIQDLLSYARSTTGGELHLELIDANRALQTALTNLRSRSDESRAVLTWDALPVVQAAEGLLTQVLQNLIGNAMKYTRTEVTPEVHISAERRGSEWVFSVRDNGQGIPRQYQQAIFQLFTRLHAREVSGTGIGLSTVKRIVERHGGRVWVESEVGVGSTFYFTLPAIR